MKNQNSVAMAIDYASDLSSIIKDLQNTKNFLVKAYAEISTKIEYLEKKREELLHIDVFI